jgi:hypothetical protein
MEKMKINSKIGHRRSQVISGSGPHRLLEMVQEKMSETLTKGLQELDSDSNLKEEEVLPSSHRRER